MTRVLSATSCLLLALPTSHGWSTPSVTSRRPGWAAARQRARLSASPTPPDDGASPAALDDRLDESPAPPVESQEDVSAFEYVVGKPGEFERDLKAMGSSPRRFFVQIFLVAPLVALAGNLFGLTSAVLGLLPDETVAASRLDTYFPTKGYTRFISSDGTYEFLHPASWLEDQAVVLFKAQQAARSVDGPTYGMRAPKRQIGPDTAFGPAARSGDNTENVSVVRSKLPRGFTLGGSLGAPADAAQRLLDTAIAPEGSGRTAKLIGAREEERRGRPHYVFEYYLKRPDGREIRNIAVIAASQGLSGEGELFTLTVLAPEAEWESKRAECEKMAATFRLL